MAGLPAGVRERQHQRDMAWEAVAKKSQITALAEARGARTEKKEQPRPPGRKARVRKNLRAFRDVTTSSPPREPPPARG